MGGIAATLLTMTAVAAPLDKHTVLVMERIPGKK